MSKYNWTLYYNHEAENEIREKLYAKMVQSGEHLRDKMIDKVSQAGGGKTYTVPGTSTSHRASAPGQPPAKMTGWLANNIETETEKSDKEIETIVGIRGGPNGVPYARRLEYGFYGQDSKGRKYNQAPRPFFEPTYQEEKETIKNLLRR